MSSLRLGFSCRWRKGERGKRVVWIVTEFELFPDKVVLGTPRKMVEDICDTLKAWDGKGMIPVKDLRTFLGKLAWVAGIVPRLKWTVTALYANLTKVQQEDQSEYERAQKRTRSENEGGPRGREKDGHHTALAACSLRVEGEHDDQDRAAGRGRAGMGGGHRCFLEG